MNDVPKRATTRLTFQDVQDWVMRERGQKISKSSITQAKAKCGLSGLNTGIKGEMYHRIKKNLFWRLLKRLNWCNEMSLGRIDQGSCFILNLMSIKCDI